MNYVRKLPTPEELKTEFPLSAEEQKRRKDFIGSIEEVLSGSSKKKILCIGPCSADREDAVLDYMSRLAELNQRVKDVLVIIPRVYTSKPRTSGLGYKGMLHRPNVGGNVDDVYEGIVATRKLHLRVIRESGLFGADEMLYSEAVCYNDDLLSYVAVGARSVEDQQHRLVASGLDMPTGMKNPTNGDFSTMLNAIKAAQSPQSLIYHGWECKTAGNPFAHAILRGYVDLNGKMYANYHYEDLQVLYDACLKANLKNTAVIVDCNHCNSRKKYDEQPRIARDVLGYCVANKAIDRMVRGLMVESYLVDGAQMVDEGFYGKSITDSCLGWDKTERLIIELAESIR